MFYQPFACVAYGAFSFKELVGIMNNGDYFEKLYATYYSPEMRRIQDQVWQILCKDFFTKFLPQETSVAGQKKVLVDLAAGGCNFINNIHSGMAEYAFDINPDVKDFAREGVTAIVDQIGHLAQHFEEGSVSVFFESNFLEHIDRETIVELFKTQHRLLREGGEIWILTPNIRYFHGAYWDLFDHITPLTERSLITLAKSLGYKVKVVVPKFIPGQLMYTKKPKWPWLVALYLKLMPVSGWFFGEQSFIILQK